MALLGCIADDFTGATDLAAMLVAQGMLTVQLIGVPDASDAVPDADAIVVALKNRARCRRRTRWPTASPPWRGCKPPAAGSSFSSTARPSTAPRRASIGPPDMVAAVLVQLERQNGCPRSD